LRKKIGNITVAVAAFMAISGLGISSGAGRIDAIAAKQEVKAQKHTAIEAEFGDVLFSLINYARFLKVNPEDALERTNKKFITRFQYLERKAAESGKSLRDMTLAEMESYWQEAKGVFEPPKQ